MRDEHPFFKWRIELKEYDKHYHFFARRLFYRDIAERILKIASLTVWDTYHLFEHARQIPPKGTYLEIGVHLGGSMLSVWHGTQVSQNSVQFIAIDKQITEEFLEVVKIMFRGSGSLTTIPLISELAKEQIPDRSVDLLFMDGDHRYSFVNADIKNYWPKLKSGGVLLGHDYNRMDGVRKAVDERFGKEKISLLTNSDIWKVQK